MDWKLRRGQIKHLLYEHCLNGRIDKQLLMEQFNDLNNVEPIKHGEWKVLASGNDAICTNCKHYWIQNGDQYDYHYCPNCGARMGAQIGEDKSHPFAESVMMGMDEVEE